MAATTTPETKNRISQETQGRMPGNTESSIHWKTTEGTGNGRLPPLQTWPIGTPENGGTTPKVSVDTLESHQTNRRSQLRATSEFCWFLLSSGDSSYLRRPAAARNWISQDRTASRIYRSLVSSCGLLSCGDIVSRTLARTKAYKVVSCFFPSDCSSNPVKSPI